MANTTKGLIKEGKLIDLGWLKEDDCFGYRTDDGRVILHDYVGNKMKWIVKGSDKVYDTLWEAYQSRK